MSVVGTQLAGHGIGRIGPGMALRERSYSCSTSSEHSRQRTVHSHPPVESLAQLKRRLDADLRRWSVELDGASPRATLSTGILQKAFAYAEQLLRSAAEIFLAQLPDGGTGVIAEVTNKKTIAISKLTFGQCVQVLAYLDSRRQLGSGRKVISKADENLLNRLSKARNAFAHGAPAEIDAVAIRQYLVDVMQLSELNAIRLAASRSELSR